MEEEEEILTQRGKRSLIGKRNFREVMRMMGYYCQFENLSALYAFQLVEIMD